jgi:hypothetical protein
LRELVWTPVRPASDASSAQVRVERAKSRRAADSGEDFGDVGRRESVEQVAQLPPFPEKDSFAHLQAPVDSRKHLWIGGLAAAALLILLFSTLLFISYHQNLRQQSDVRSIQSATPAPTPRVQDATPPPSTPIKDATPPPSPPAENSTPPPVTAGNPSTDASADKNTVSPVSAEPEDTSGNTPPPVPSGESNPESQASAVHKTPVEPEGAAVVKAQDSQPVAQPANKCWGYFRNDIPDLFKKADRDAGVGKYSEALYAYAVVLCLDPGNARAKAGQQKVKRAAELNSQ